MARVLKKPWLQAYLDYVAETESPEQFNLWSGISAIGSSLKRKVWVQRGFYKIYPNQYIVLVGPPGVGKGTAINPAIELVDKSQTANYLHDRITAEKIIDRLAQGFSVTVTTPTGIMPGARDTSATIVSTELPVLLGGSDWMLPLFCEMWDKNKFEYDTKTKGTFTVKDLSVSIIAGCVPDYIRRLNRDATTAITGGFTSRCIFVYASEKSKNKPWPDLSVSSKLEDDLINDLREIALMHGEFSLTKEAMTYWTSFYNSNNIDQFENEVVANFKARIPAHVLKVAMILSCAEDNSRVISKTHLFNAIELINKVRDKLEVVFRAVGESSLAAAQDRIMRYIEAKGVVSRAELLKANYRHVTDEDLTRVMQVLCAAGFCTDRAQGGKIMYTHIAPYKGFKKGAGVP